MPTLSQKKEQEQQRQQQAKNGYWRNELYSLGILEPKRKKEHGDDCEELEQLADIIKQAMINVHRRLLRECLQAKLLLQIHDELVLEFPPEERDRLEALVTEEMSSAAKLAVPLKVDIHVGPDWAACE